MRLHEYPLLIVTNEGSRLTTISPHEEVTTCRHTQSKKSQKCCTSAGTRCTTCSVPASYAASRSASCAGSRTSTSPSSSHLWKMAHECVASYCTALHTCHEAPPHGPGWSPCQQPRPTACALMPTAETSSKRSHGGRTVTCP